MRCHSDQIDDIASRLVRRYGADARAEAASWAQAMFSLEDPRNAVAWTQIGAAVARLLDTRMPATKPRHRIKAGRLEIA